MKIRLTVKNESRVDYGRVYEYNSLLDYLFDNRESFDELLEEDGHSCLTDEEMKWQMKCSIPTSKADSIQISTLTILGRNKT